MLVTLDEAGNPAEIDSPVGCSVVLTVIVKVLDEVTEVLVTVITVELADGAVAKRGCPLLDIGKATSVLLHVSLLHAQ